MDYFVYTFHDILLIKYSSLLVHYSKTIQVKILPTMAD